MCGSVPGASQGAGGAGADLFNGSALAFFLARVLLSRCWQYGPTREAPKMRQRLTQGDAGLVLLLALIICMAVF